MSYQAVIRDASSTLITNQVVGIRISILQGSESGTLVYEETNAPTTNTNGLISLTIGNGTVISGDFETIDWANGPYFIQTETDITGGSNYTISGTSQLLSVPYALHAKTAENVKTYNIGDFAQGGVVFWVDETKQHGLACTMKDYGSDLRWYAGTNGKTRATGDGIYSGKANTLLIIATQVAIGDDENPYAAAVCNDLLLTTVNDFGDWYLPSRFELNLMYENRSTINATALQNGGESFETSENYWSSTEQNFLSAWGQNFNTGALILLGKNVQAHFRAIRSF
jgi:hypothetical protein